MAAAEARSIVFVNGSTGAEFNPRPELGGAFLFSK
jgi:hypothetical protein